MNPRASALAAALALSAAGCIFSGTQDSCEGVVCPEPRAVPIVSGAYVRPSFAETPSPQVPFPHDDGRARSLVIDRDAGVATFTSTRDGSTVVERWRIRPPPSSSR